MGAPSRIEVFTGVRHRRISAAGIKARIVAESVGGMEHARAATDVIARIAGGRRSRIDQLLLWNLDREQG